MPVISDAAIASAAKSAGLPDNKVAIAVAIALAESGGNTNSHNPVFPDDSYGLWQINALAHSKSSLGISSYDQLYDPLTNAKAMMKISGGGKNWKPWTTYTRGRYLAFLGRGQKASSGTSSLPDTGITTPVASTSGIAHLGNLISDPAVYRKASMYIGGSILIIIGLVLLFRIQNLTPIGKAASIIKAVK